MIGDMSKHASPESLVRNSSATPAAWAVLVGMGATSVTFNIYHSLTAFQWPLGLALLYGIAPVFTAFCLSHVVAAHKGGWVMQVLLYLVVLGAMSMSIGSVAVVVAPVAGAHLKWLFGAVIDGSALIALRVVLSERERMGKDVAALETAMSSAQEAGERATLLEVELGNLRGELEAARLERDELRARTGLPGVSPKRSQGKARTAPKRVATDHLSIEGAALELLEEHPDMSGAALARQLGVSPGYGRKLRARLARGDRPVERRDGTPGVTAPETAEERS